MGSRTTHHLDEVPVLTCGITVALDITDKLRVSLTSSVETEGGFNLRVLQVAVDGLRTTNDLNAVVLGCIVLSQHTGIGIRVVATDDDDSLDIELTDNLKSLLELLDLLKLRTARTYHVKTTGIAILVDDFLRELHIVMVNKTTRSQDEAVQTVLGIELLYLIEKARNDIVSARSLATAQDDTHVHLCGVGLCCWLELHDGHAVGVGEQLLNLFLVADTLRGLAFLDFYCTLKSLWQLGLIGGSCDLQRTLFHND